MRSFFDFNGAVHFELLTQCQTINCYAAVTFSQFQYLNFIYKYFGTMLTIEERTAVVCAV